jgi:hypothetical protein
MWKVREESRILIRSPHQCRRSKENIPNGWQVAVSDTFQLRGMGHANAVFSVELQGSVAFCLVASVKCLIEYFIPGRDVAMVTNPRFVSCLSTCLVDAGLVPHIRSAIAREAIVISP